MQTSYFSEADHQALSAAASDAQAAQQVHAKLFELHQALHRRMRDRNWDVHPHWDKARIISGHSASCHGEIAGLVLPYLRSKEQAALVERLMGRDYAQAAAHTDSTRHPAIELRITPANFVVELVLNPAAWWDQRNLIGKLSIDRHRTALRSILQRMNQNMTDDFRFGFFEGCHLNDMHLNARHLLRGKVLEEWMSTFADGQDWLRVGIWYPPDHAALAQGSIVNEVLLRLEPLYDLYHFIVWTSNNNYQNFYPKSSVVPNSRDQHYN
ncbi:MAG: hypothetical protein SF162_12985 [bacterium]|nr:hypothetical protein [bacterium]